jgi:exoribonuclease-2
MEIIMSGGSKYLGAIVEYLDQGKLRPAMVIRENDSRVGVLDSSGREKSVARDLILLRHPEHRADAADLAPVLAEIDAERGRLAAELDLDLLWEVVHEQNRPFTANELAELFFGRRSAAATAVVLEALLNDRLYFTRRHMDFIARSAEQVERLRLQQSRERLKSESARRTRNLVKSILDGEPVEVLDRLGALPDVPRFALVGGLPGGFSEAVRREAVEVVAPERAAIADELFAITIDDEETLEVDDALSCVVEPDGVLRVCVHIALTADFVPRGGAMDKEAAGRAATVYLPEAIVRMLPEEISCGRASLIAGEMRSVLTTDVRIGAKGEILSQSIYPGRMRIGARLDYRGADSMLAEGPNGDSDPIRSALWRLNGAAAKLRERRRRAGAAMFHRRESKVRVRGDEIDIEIIDHDSPSRNLVAEFMVLSNHVAARYAADHRVPMIYRVQPGDGGDLMMQRARLSLYPEYHAGIGLECYAQLSSPIRRYADLVLQRQLIAALGEIGPRPYDANELLTILANTENAEIEAKELERRAKRYWMLRYLERNAIDRELAATAFRDGQSAELNDYAVRGSLHGAPPLPTEAQIMVRIDRIDPLRGLLVMSYAGPAHEDRGPS